MEKVKLYIYIHFYYNWFSSFFNYYYYYTGEKTITDLKVRSSKRIKNVTFKNSKKWNDYVNEKVQSVESNFGMEKKVEAEFHNLLLYKEGDFFKSHRDSEKGVGYFGTLIFVLPFKHRGGMFQIHHDGEKIRIQTSKMKMNEIHWFAFYGDCSHQLKKVEKGYRIALVYNLYVDRKKDEKNEELKKNNEENNLSPLLKITINELHDLWLKESYKRCVLILLQ